MSDQPAPPEPRDDNPPKDAADLACSSLLAIDYELAARCLSALSFQLSTAKESPYFHSECGIGEMIREGCSNIEDSIAKLKSMMGLEG